MDRRVFLKTAGITSAAILAGINFTFPKSSDTPEIAITIDDFNVKGNSIITGEEINRKMLEALSRHKNLKAAFFVTGKYAETKENTPLLKNWNDEGHLICNHTYSHTFYPKDTFENFSSDILKNEQFLSQFTQFRKYFRFPFLKEGKTEEQRDLMRKFLADHGYEMGYVTVDASDWFVDMRLKERVIKNPKAKLSGYKDFYLKHIFDRAEYYNNLSKKVLGRSVKHTLLIHHSVLNGLFLGDLLDMFERKGWRLINAEEAFTDPVFKARPNIAPAGESILWALAKETGKYEKLLRYPAEDSIYEEPKMNRLKL